MASKFSLDVKPVSPVSSTVVHDQNDRVSLVQLQEKVASADRPGDGMPVGKQRQIIGCLDLEENDPSLDFTVDVESRHDQIVPIIAVHSLY
jgi:hypothetical protein